MPLSEQEQRLLEEMERSLYHNDADFVATVPARRGRPNYTVLAVGILVGILGVAVLVTGVIIHQPLVGVLGFAVMFAGVLIVVTPPRQPVADSTDRSHAAKEGSSSFMKNMNDRWEKRQDERDQ